MGLSFYGKDSIECSSTSSGRGSLHFVSGNPNVKPGTGDVGIGLEESRDDDISIRLGNDIEMVDR